jgi:hypothetical protein
MAGSAIDPLLLGLRKRLKLGHSRRLYPRFEQADPVVSTVRRFTERTGVIHAPIRFRPMPAARRSKARRSTAARPQVDPVWEIALDEIEIQIKTLPPKFRKGSASWLRSARKTIRDAEKALGGSRTVTRTTTVR